MPRVFRDDQELSTGEKFAQAFSNMGQTAGQMIPQYLMGKQAEKKAKDQYAQENEAIFRETGINLSGIRDQKSREEAFKAAVKAKFDKSELDHKNKLRQQMIGDVEGQQDNRHPLSGSLNEPSNNSIGVKSNIGQPIVSQENETDPYKKARQYAAIGEHDLSTVATKESDRSFEEKKLKTKEVSGSYDENKDFINKSYDQYEDSLRREAILDRMDQLNDSEQMSDSGAINALESLGLNQEWLKNPANEEYNKLSLDLLGGGSLQADYGSRVLQSEFKVSQQRIPTLSQTKEGRKQIAQNIKTMLLPSKLKKERMKVYLDRQERTGDPLPHNLRGRILNDIKPQLEEAYDAFKQRNGRYKVKDGTEPSDQDIEKYYFISDGDLAQSKKMMKEDGYAVD